MTEAQCSGEERAPPASETETIEAQRRWWRRWVAYIPLLLALGAIAALIVSADPHKIGIAFQRFNLVYVPIVMVLGVGFYLVQGVRWWTLNRALGINFPCWTPCFSPRPGRRQHCCRSVS